MDVWGPPGRLSKTGTCLKHKPFSNHHHHLVGGLEHFLFFHILGMSMNVIIPTDFHIFQRGRSTTNQLWFSQQNQSIDSWYIPHNTQILHQIKQIQGLSGYPNDVSHRFSVSLTNSCQRSPAEACFARALCAGDRPEGQKQWVIHDTLRGDHGNPVAPW